MFKIGAVGALGTLGACTLALGVLGIAQGVLTRTQSDMEKGGEAFITGAVQLWAGMRILRPFPIDPIPVLALVVAGVVGAAAGSIVAGMVVKTAAVQKWVDITRVVVGVATQTAVGVVAGGVTAIATILLAKGAVYLWKRGQEACMRRNNPELRPSLLLAAELRRGAYALQTIVEEDSSVVNEPDEV